MTTRGYTTYFQINEVMCDKIKSMEKTNSGYQHYFVINLPWIIKIFIYILLRYNFWDALEVKESMN